MQQEKAHHSAKHGSYYKELKMCLCMYCLETHNHVYYAERGSYKRRFFHKFNIFFKHWYSPDLYILEQIVQEYINQANLNRLRR